MQIKPGRNIDVFIAKNILKWVIINEGEHIGAPDSSLSSAVQEIPHYSTRIGDAWQLINHFQDAHIKIEKHSFYIPAEWIVTIDGHERRHRLVAFAICLAAFDAIGVEVG